MTLTEALQRFNRKERHWLVRDALGPASARLGENFADRVQAAIRLRDQSFKIDRGAWWAIDFHIDWLVAALHMLRHGSETVAIPQLNAPMIVTGSQQDIDLVIASESTLVLIEAKGVGSWAGAGLDSKVARLSALPSSVVNLDGKSGEIQLHFVLCSPGKPPCLDTSAWNSWMKTDQGILHIDLNVVAEAGQFLRVQRCSEAESPNDKWTHWQAINDLRSNSLVNK
ncbi:hypothetical protein AFCDBAGC_2065 [Methylobacterium cerastii]|uniref:NERD domain-containing protein n=1 Tax=Methylobacterium cerastii TaxID=932741 RepID=A0ABQ4QH72_9HYPH|nr:hypothetical protein [Methylobacterium cerastii]GJD44200.1 hypothetical protein AFCDBAGC_2065 [Methylobacterium cerastii]